MGKVFVSCDCGYLAHRDALVCTKCRRTLDVVAREKEYERLEQAYLSVTCEEKKCP